MGVQELVGQSFGQFNVVGTSSGSGDRGTFGRGGIGRVREPDDLFPRSSGGYRDQGEDEDTKDVVKVGHFGAVGDYLRFDRKKR